MKIEHTYYLYYEYYLYCECIIKMGYQGVLLKSTMVLGTWLFSFPSVLNSVRFARNV